MSPARQGTIRDVVLESLATGAPVSRGRLLRVVAEHLGLPPEQRQLRAEVARVTRSLEAEGVIVDAGPEVYLADTGAGLS